MKSIRIALAAACAASLAACAGSQTEPAEPTSVAPSTDVSQEAAAPAEEASAAEAPAQPSADEQVAGLVADCASSEQARAARHAAVPLYQRLGGDARVLELTTKIVELHNKNPKLTQIMAGIDGEVLATRVAEFISAGTGGTAKYTGRDMKTAHEHLGITNETFLAAGGDVATAMKSLGIGDEEIQEMICILVSLKDEVILK